MIIARLALLMILCALLFGCDSPSLAFQSTPAQQITVGPSTFSVRVKGDMAEAMRTSREWRPSESAVLGRADEAIRKASGCEIAKNGLTGDQAIIRARLDCSGRVPS